jgi:UPF0755 protein
MGGGVITKADFLYRLSHAKAAMTEITLIPGETAHIFLEQLSSELNLSLERLQREYDKAAPYSDGWLVPETYKVPLGIDESALVRVLMSQSDKAQRALAIALTGTYDEPKWREILVIASIIQKESASVAEMPIVSSVIYNRLAKKMRLQMDGTLNYGAFSHVRITPKRIREDTTPYNTYMYAGVPPTPVCAVSREAIAAAVNPAKSEYLYFVKGADGSHIFTRTYKEHLKSIKRGN